jgi:hypothetical protein
VLVVGEIFSLQQLESRLQTSHNWSLAYSSKIEKEHDKVKIAYRRAARILAIGRGNLNNEKGKRGERKRKEEKKRRKKRRKK